MPTLVDAILNTRSRDLIDDCTCIMFLIFLIKEWEKILHKYCTLDNSV